MWRAIFILLAVPAAAQDPVKILETRCAGCHNAKTKQGGLDLTSRPAALRGGPRGPALVPGDAEASPLYQFAAHRKEPGMPLGGAKLTETDLAALAAWIRAGAPFTGPLEDKTHWAFEAVRRPAVPAGAGHPIDAFLGPSAEPANRYTLLRRVSLDLTGLPPTPAEINAFPAGQSPGAWDAVVDRLLASPRYGERWGRHWMDIWRYSDWIIESLNANKSCGQMVREMLAANEIAPGDPNALRATGFLGLTLKCARCHDHKYHPLSQEDYYRFRAFFEPHDVRLDRVPGQADLAKDGLSRVFDAAPRQDLANAAGTFLQPAIYADTFLFHKGDEKNPDRSRPLSPATPPALGPGIAAVRPVALPVNSYYPDLRPEVRAALLAAARARVEDIARDLAGTRARPNAARTALPWVRPAGPAVDFDRQVKPLLEARCGGFNVATAKSVMAGGKRFGAAVEVGRSAQSPLLRIVRGELSPRMPLNGPPLTSAEIALLAAWIDGMEPPPPAALVREAEERLAVGEKELTAARAHVEPGAPANPDPARTEPNGGTATETLAAQPAQPNAPTQPAGDESKPAQSPGALAARTAEAELLRAQQRLAGALSAEKLDDTKVAPAKRALEQAIEALNKPAEGYTPLGPLYPKTATGRRTALAVWITRRDNPLTARVAVNHIWLRHFGTPLVASVADFGRNGKTPTHPALLDWLAAEFVDSNWDLKTLHRLIVTSQAYRARTTTAPRLEAEVIRDSVLAAAENLDLTMSGPELHEESQADTPRRSLYFRVTPDAQLTFLKVFDGVDPSACFVRPESIVPQQALARANSRLSLENARRLAARLAPAHGSRTRPRPQLPRQQPGSPRAAHPRSLQPQRICDHPMKRRTFLADTGIGMTGLALGALRARCATHHAAKAKLVIWIFLEGGLGQLESFDPKPELNKWAGKTIAETPHRGVLDAPFTKQNVVEFTANDRKLMTTVLPLQVGFRRHGQSGLAISDWWPHVAGLADELAVVRSVWTIDNDHAAQLQFHTGRHIFQGYFPSIGSWVHCGLGTLNENLPAFVVLGPPTPPHLGGAGTYGANYLGPRHSGVLLASDPAHPLPYAAPGLAMTPEEQRRQFEFIGQLNALDAVEYPEDSSVRARIKSYELAFRMQSAVPEVFRHAAESADTRRLYGLEQEKTRHFGQDLLTARRLFERGVRFVQIFHGYRTDANGWDSHAELKKNHARLCGEVDGPIAALIRDLKQRGMRDETLLVIGTEFGRTPGVEGAREGRDHHPFGFSVVMAGGGLKKGIAHGATDEIGFHTVENRHYVTDIHATVLHQLGLDSRKLEIPGQKRLEIDIGAPIREIIA